MSCVESCIEIETEVLFPMNISKLHYISDEIQRKLNDSGITTLAQLIELKYSHKERYMVSMLSGVNSECLRYLAEMAVFYQIDGINGKYTRIFEKIGVSSIEKLACLNPNELIDMIIQHNVNHHLIDDVPDVWAAQNWINQAQQILDFQKAN